jgi:DNA replication protein DnaC
VETNLNNNQNLVEENITKLRLLRLYGIANLYQEQSQDPDIIYQGFDERFNNLINNEQCRKESIKINNLLKKANFEEPSARVEDIIYDKDRCIDKNIIIELSKGIFYNNKQNIFILGASGAGKTYLATAIGIAAVKLLIPVKYTRMPDLLISIKDAKESKDSSKYNKLINVLRNCPILIIDDWLLYELNKEQTSFIMEIIYPRFNKMSTIINSQYQVTGWLKRFGDVTVGEAIMDRLVHNAIRINIQGEKSMREIISNKNNNKTEK